MVEIERSEGERERHRRRRRALDLQTALAMRGTEIELQMVEHEPLQRAVDIGAERQRLRRGRGRGIARDDRQGRARIIGAELHLTGNVSVVERSRQPCVKLELGRRHGGDGEPQRQLRRIEPPAIDLEADLGTARHQAPFRVRPPAGRVGSDARVDVLETLRHPARAVDDDAVLNRHAIDGEAAEAVGARRRASREGRASAACRRRRSRDPPIRCAVRHPLEVELGLDQGRAVDLEAARQQRQKGRLHFERAEP